VLPSAEGRPIVAAGLDHQGESVLAWDAKTGAPRSPIIVWQDKRGSEAYERVAPELLARTGLPPDPYFSAPKLAWLARELGDLDGVRLGTVDAWLSDRLGAGSATDPSTASRTALQALATPGWDAELCAAFGVPRAALPTVMPTVGDLGVLRHARWGAHALPLRARVCDQQAALAGAGCVVPGRAKATYGTGVFVLAHAGKEVPHAEGLLPTVAWQAGGRVEYALDGGVFTAGALLEWLSGTLGLAADPRALTALAATVPDAGGVRVLPALAGAGAPWWRPDAQAVIAGLSAGTTPAHIARAALEGIAHRVADVVEALGGGLEVLRVDGGLTNDALLCQLQADVLHTPIERGSADATVAGAAGLALVGAGIVADVSALDGLLAPAERFEPALPIDDVRRARRHWRSFASGALDLVVPSDSRA
jgi:glycerol kinase